MCKSRIPQPAGPIPGPDTGNGTIMAAVRALVPNHPACAEALSLAKNSLPASILYHSIRVYLYAHAFLRIFQEELTPLDPTLPLPLPLPLSGISGIPTDDPAAEMTMTTTTTTASPPSSSSSSLLLSSSSSGLFTTTDILGPACIARAPAHVLFVACLLHDIGTSPDHDVIPERFEVVSADVAARILRSHGIPEPAVRDAWLAMSLHTSPGIAERLGGTVRSLRLAVRADFGSYPTPKADLLPGGEDTARVIRWKLPRLEIEKDLGDAVVRQAFTDPIKAPSASWPGDLLRAKRQDPAWEGVNPAF